MADWWEDLPDRSDDRKKAEKLVNVLAKYPGTRDQKVQWAERNMALIEAEALKFEARTPEGHRGAIMSVTIRFYRRWWAEGHGERPQQQGKRDGNVVSLRRTLKDG
jgi:hypothetical protein